MVGAGVASPEASMETRLPLDNEIGMSASKSGSGGAQKRSEKPAALTGSSFLLDSIAGESRFCLLGLVVASFSPLSVATGGAGLVGGALGLFGGPPGRGGGGFDGAEDSELLFSDSTSPSDVGSDLSVANGGAGRVGGALGLFGGPAGRWGGGGFDGAEESGASDSPYDRIRFNCAINVCQTWISVAQTSTVFG